MTAVMASAQAGVTTLGLLVKPVIPLSFFDPKSEVKAPAVRGSLDLTGGLAFGMVVRAGISNSVSLETGIDQINRSYDIAMANDTSGYAESDRIRFVGYEIPVMGLVYIRLGERSWMNNALGLSVDMYPSDAERVQSESRVYLARTGWLRMGVVGNIGVEYRTARSGWFYLGATYHRPFNDMAVAEYTFYERDGFAHTVKKELSGSYLTLDLRYFFHTDPERAQRRRDRSGQD